MKNIVFNKQFWQAVAILVGTIIGAGILGIPYVIAQSGFLSGLGIIVLLGLAAMIINLMIAEVMMRTRFRHQLSGLAGKYLGKPFEHIQALSVIIGTYGGLTAYIIGEGQVLSVLFGTPEKNLQYSLLFLLIGTIILLIGLRIIKVLETFLVLLLILALLVITGWSLPSLDLSNLVYNHFDKMFVPYGVLLFAYGGMGSIFSIKEVLNKKKHLIRPAIIVGSLIPLILYALFAFIVVGVTGLATTDIATIGLGATIGYKILLVSNIFAVLAMATSFFTLGIGLLQLFHFDYRLPVWLSWLLVIIFPLMIFLFVSHNFIQVIGTAGSLTFGLTGVLVVLSFWRAKKEGDQQPAFSLPKFKWVGLSLVAMFTVGFALTIIKLFS